MRFRSIFGSWRGGGVRSVPVFEVTALYLHPFNPAGMPLFLIVIHANQKNFTAVIFQAIQIVLLFDLFHRLEIVNNT